ncbi:MAG: hypothetical protein QM820_48865 [Minicystis sp.]
MDRPDEPVTTSAPPIAAPPEPAAEEQPEEELAPISGAFFVGEVPLSAEPENDEHPEVPETPEDAPAVAPPPKRLRYVVIGATVVAGLIAGLAIGKVLAKRHAPPAARESVPVATVASVAPKPEVAAPPATLLGAVASAAVKPIEPKAEPTAAPAPPEKAEPASADRGTAEASAKTAKASDPPGSGETLKRQTLSLLNRGALAEAIPIAREAVAADPDDALGYLYLGSALQGVGRLREGREAYNECVRHATRGPVSECRLMGGQK